MGLAGQYVGTEGSLYKLLCCAVFTERTFYTYICCVTRRAGQIVEARIVQILLVQYRNLSNSTQYTPR
jgi:hypothetical protein